MIQTTPPAKIRIGIADAESDEHLVMMIANGTQCDFHQLSLAQARAIALELIKNVYQAELRNSLNMSKEPHHFSFRVRHQI
jgi:hypothetical protein